MTDEDAHPPSRIPMKGGLEYDALSRWHRFLNWRPRERKQAKRSYSRRLRHIVKEMLRVR